MFVCWQLSVATIHHVLYAIQPTAPTAGLPGPLQPNSVTEYDGLLLRLADIQTVAALCCVHKGCTPTSDDYPNASLSQVAA